MFLKIVYRYHDCLSAGELLAVPENPSAVMSDAIIMQFRATARRFRRARARARREVGHYATVMQIVHYRPISHLATDTELFIDRC